MALAPGSCAGAHLGSSDDSHYLEVCLADDTCSMALVQFGRRRYVSKHNTVIRRNITWTRSE